MHLEHAEAEGRAGLAGEQVDDLVTTALEDVRGAQEDRPGALRGASRPRPGSASAAASTADARRPAFRSGTHDRLAGERVGPRRRWRRCPRRPISPPTKLRDSLTAAAVSVDCVMVALLSKDSESSHRAGWLRASCGLGARESARSIASLQRFTRCLSARRSRPAACLAVVTAPTPAYEDSFLSVKT